MPLLFSNEITNAILEELSGAEDSVQIITAFAKTDAFELFSNAVPNTVNKKRLMVRGRLSDVVSGSLDFDLLEIALSKGWDVYLRFDLHAKTYIVDNSRCILGSANATNAGMSLRGFGNTEMAALAEIDKDDIFKIERLYYGSLVVDEALIEMLKAEIPELPSKPYQTYQWSSQITDKARPLIETLFSYELPDKKEYAKGEYIPFLDIINTDEDTVRDTLKWSNAYLWLTKQLQLNDGTLYFGEITEKLHNALVSDPKPYRKDVKILLSNFLWFIQSYDIEELIVDQPNHSQRVRLR